MIAPMPNPFLSEIPHAGSPAPSVSLSAKGAGGVPRFVLDERAYMAAMLNLNPRKVTAGNSTAAVSNDAAAAFVSFPAPPSLAPDSAAAELIIAPIPEGSAAVTPILDSEKNIATLLALAAIETASAEHSSTSKQA